MGRLVYVREDREAEPRFVGSTQGARTTFTPGTQPLFNNLGMTGSRQIYVSNLPYTVGWQDLKDLFRQAAQGGAVIRADVHTGPDGRPKGSGIVVFENPVDAHNAIQQFNGFDWHGRMLEVREDRFAGAGNNPYLPAGRGFANNRGPFMGSFARGGFSGGRGGSGFGFGGGRGYSQGLAGFDHVAGPSVAPNPFTDFATAGSDRSETIFVRNLPWSTSNDDLVELFTTIGKVDQAEIQYEPSGRSKGTGVVRFDTIETAETAINKFQGYQYGGRPLSLSFVKYLNSAGAGVETLMTDAHAGLSQDQIM
jgi:RNA recognition motif-containing protein